MEAVPQRWDSFLPIPELKCNDSLSIVLYQEMTTVNILQRPHTAHNLSKFKSNFQLCVEAGWPQYSRWLRTPCPGSSSSLWRTWTGMNSTEEHRHLAGLTVTVPHPLQRCSLIQTAIGAQVSPHQLHDQHMCRSGDIQNVIPTKHHMYKS